MVLFIMQCFQPQVASSLLGPNILLNTQLTNIISLLFPYCDMPSLTTEHNRQNYTAVCGITIFSFPTRQEDKRLWTDLYQSISKICS